MERKKEREKEKESNQKQSAQPPILTYLYRHIWKYTENILHVEANDHDNNKIIINRTDIITMSSSTYNYCITQEYYIVLFDPKRTLIKVIINVI